MSTIWYSLCKYMLVSLQNCTSDKCNDVHQQLIFITLFSGIFLSFIKKLTKFQHLVLVDCVEVDGILSDLFLLQRVNLEATLCNLFYTIVIEDNTGSWKLIINSASNTDGTPNLRSISITGGHWDYWKGTWNTHTQTHTQQITWDNNKNP